MQVGAACNRAHASERPLGLTRGARGRPGCHPGRARPASLWPAVAPRCFIRVPGENWIGLAQVRVVHTFTELLGIWLEENRGAFDDHVPWHGHEGYMTKEELVACLSTLVNDEAYRIVHHGAQLKAVDRVLTSELKRLVEAAEGGVLFRRDLPRNQSSASSSRLQLYRFDAVPGVEPEVIHMPSAFSTYLFQYIFATFVLSRLQPVCQPESHVIYMR